MRFEKKSYICGTSLVTLKAGLLLELSISENKHREKGFIDWFSENGSVNVNKRAEHM